MSAVKNGDDVANGPWSFTLRGPRGRRGRPGGVCRQQDSGLTTLKAWGIGIRGSRLVPEQDFAASLRNASPALTALETRTIDSVGPSDDVAEQILQVIESLVLVDNQAKLVASTKVLHHLLPALVPPMDRAWTGKFFRFHPPAWQSQANQRRIFRTVFSALACVARQVQPERLVTGRGWRTSRTKILDNALIAFCQAAPTGHITVEVNDLPPAKNEALSVLSPHHRHAPRVRLLLEGALNARDEQEFVPIDEGPIALDVVLRADPTQPPWDATNYLGGIADVLEDKSRRGTLPHLGDLADVWLYRNDRQLKEITYREVTSTRSGYTVTIRRIESP